MTKSEVFTQYNKANGAVKNGKLEQGRVNRALGIVQTKAEDIRYTTTIGTCTCPDSIYRPTQTCKHRVALMIDQRVLEQQDADVYTARNYEMAKVEAVESKADKAIRELGF